MNKFWNMRRESATASGSTTLTGRRSERSRVVSLCRPGVEIITVAYTLLAVGSLAMTLHHKDLLYLPFVAAYASLAGLSSYKLYATRAKRQGHAPAGGCYK